ncbi:hypothetical protein E4U09_003674 [Claviceps aff. purpurea]|uniref:Uncharacterized protein n=1 Tax=Claviceps aff. purpurea TaxID=1967640 RepID=A0A9P7QE38_9HYPO|nr:hypothetical protein E4U09_003674 [Claviceps aff. purpurea]
MVHKATHPTTTGVYDQSVRCVNFNTGAGKHLDDYHPPHTVADMDHLQRLFDNHQETAPTDVCGTWDTFHAKKRECVTGFIRMPRHLQIIYNQSGRESSSLSEVDLDTLSEEDLERMHPSGAFYPDPYDERNRARRNTATRAPAGRPSAPRISSPLADQDRTVRPTAESQSSVQSSPLAGLSPAPSQGRDNRNGRSLASRTLEQSQLALNEQAAEQQRLANAAEAQRQEYNQIVIAASQQFMTAQMERIRAGQTPLPYDEAMFKLKDKI